MLFKRLLALLALLGGFIGVLIGLAGIVAVWRVGSRLSHANEVVFERIDLSLTAVRGRVLKAQRRTQELKITAEDIGQSLKDWTRQEALQRVAERLDVEQKAERLGSGLQQADHYLELAGATADGVQQILTLGSAAGVPLDASLVDPVHEQLASLRDHFKQAVETVDGIRQRATEIAAGQPAAERLSQAVQLAVRGVATLGELDVRLGRTGDQLSAARTKAQQVKSRTHAWIVAGQVGVIFVLAWLAAGQASLCVHGWNGYRSSRGPPPRDAS